MHLNLKISRGLSAAALAAIMVVGFGEPARAQSGLPHEGHGGKSPVAHMTARLGLTSVQEAEIKAIFDKHFAEHRAKREQMEADLTPEQKAQREAKRKEWEARRQANSGSEKGTNEHATGEHRMRHPGPRGENMTDEQKQAFHQKMEAERAAIDSEIQAVLTPEQQKIFVQMKSERRSPRDGRPGGPRPDNG